MKARNMKPKHHKIIFLLIGIWTFLSASPLLAVEDSILAIVNDEVITHRDLSDYINSTYVALATQGYTQKQLDDVMKDLEKNGLTKLIEDKLILSKANQMGMTINDKVIEEKINE